MNLLSLTKGEVNLCVSRTKFSSNVVLADVLEEVHRYTNKHVHSFLIHMINMI